MEEPKEQIPPQPQVTEPPKKASRFWVYVRRTLLVIFLLLLVVIAATQTGPFRDFLRSKVVEFVEEETNAKITIGDIGGNFVTGTSIENVTVRLKDDTTIIATIPELSIRYSLWDLIFTSDITITEAWLKAPTVHLMKAKGDSVWNIAKIIKPTPPSTEKKPFLQTIKLTHLGIDNGTFDIYDANDSSAPATVLIYDNPLNKKSIRLSNMKLRNVMLSMSGKVQGEHIQYVNIEHLSFAETTAPFTINHLSLIAQRDHSNVEVKDLHLISDRSNIKIDASMTPLAVLEGKPYDSLGLAATHLRISATSVSQLELSQWFPDLAFLAGNPKFEFEAEGPYSNLTIKQGRLDFGTNGVLTFVGDVVNLHRPEQIAFDVELTGKNLSDHTMRTYTPGLAIPSIRQYGIIAIPKLTYKGTTTQFTSIFSIRTGAGSVDGKAQLDFTKSEPSYAADLNTESLNLASIVSDSTLRSSMNLSVHAKGSGFDIHTMNSTFVIDGTSNSTLYNLEASKIHLDGSLQAGTASLEQSSVAFTDGSSIDADYANINLNDSLLPYECDVSIKEVPIAKFVPAFPRSSIVNANATLFGKVKSLGQIKGSFHSVISGLTYHTDTLAPILVTATLQYNDSVEGRSDIIASDIADITVKGKYDVQKLGEVLADRLNAFAHSFDDFRRDSTVERPDSVPRYRVITCADSLHCEFTANFKDLRPLDHFLPGMTLLAKGKLEGSIIGCPNEAMDIRIDGNLKHLLVKPYLRDSNSLGVPTIVARGLQVRIGLRNLVTNTNEVLAKARGGIRISSDSNLLFINGIGISHPFASVRLDYDSIRYTIAGNIDDKLSVRFKGNAFVLGQTKSFVLDSVRVKFSEGFEWNNEARAVFSVGNNSIKLDSLTLIKPEPSFDPGNRFAQRITLGGEIVQDTIRYAFMHSTQLKAEEIPKFFSAWSDMSALSSIRGRLPLFNVDMKGTLSHPTIETDLAVPNLTYSSIRVDTGRIHLVFSDNTLRGQALLHIDTEAFWIESVKLGREKIIPSRNNKLDIQIDSVPFLFSLADYPQKKADSIKNQTRPLSLRVETFEFPLDIFGPFLPIVAEFHGLGNVSLTANGTLDQIKYGGDINIIHGSFLLPFTNVKYNIEGPIHLSNDELIFDRLAIGNIAGDDPNGRATLDGKLFFKGFEIDSMRFVLETQRLLVLNDASRESLKSIYGPLIIQSGSEPITFHGTMDRPHLDGDINVLQAYLTLPPTITAADLQSDGITYIIASTNFADSAIDEDTTIKKKLVERDYEEEAFMAEVSPGVPTVMITPLLDPQQFVESKASFNDKMLYNLRVSIPGDFWLTIPFNRGYGLTGELLRAEMKSNGIIRFNRDVAYAPYQLSGTLALTGNSSYKFIKEFSPVSGTIEFQENLDNPRLDLHAQYIGAHDDNNKGDVKIVITITGTKNDPHVVFELWYVDKTTKDFVQDRSRTQAEIQKDAVLFLATGNLASDGQQTDIKTLGENTAFSGAALIANTIISEVLPTSAKEYIRSVGVEYGENSQAKLRLTAAYHNITFRGGAGVGGIAGTNQFDFAVETPFSTVFNFPHADDLLLTGERHIGGTVSSAQLPPYMGTISYRISLP